MSYSITAVAFTVLAFGSIFVYWKRSHRSIAHLPGPPSSSWLVGNIPSIHRAENAGDADSEWNKEYGNTFRIRGCFGEDVLYISDPTAMQYVLNRRGYNFPKSWEHQVFLRLSTGRGIISAEGAQHARHRRVMLPSFSQSALKRHIPLFLDISRRTTTSWTRMIRKESTETSVLDVTSLLARTTFDAIGEAAFGCKFNSIEATEPSTELQKAYQNLFVDFAYMPSDFDIIIRRLLGYSPLWLSDILISLPKKDLQRLNNYMSIARKLAKRLVDRQMHAEANGKEGGKDVLSLFVKANNAEDPRRRLEEDEVLSQITSLLLAGHDTTANSLSWVLYELSKQSDVQHKLREEVRATLDDVASRGESELTMSDLDSMTYMIAVIKETLRYHPIVDQLSRRAALNDIIPIGTPVKTVSGETITAIPIRKGQIVHLGLGSYNRLQSIWGQDADEWRPQRFLDELPNQQKANLGVFGNLATFSSGLRSCIGWRFSMMEMQAILVELIDNFNFSPAPNIEIRRAASGIMQSMVKGQEHKGAQLPLIVSIMSKEDADLRP